MLTIVIEPRHGGVRVRLLRRKIICLDCEPLAPRPDACLPDILERTGLEARVPTSKVFGAWTFDYSTVDDRHWRRICPVLARNMHSLYAQNRIRYGEWTVLE